MPRAATITRLPLDRWAKVLGINPRHFAQVSAVVNPATMCSSPVKQHAWQEANQIGREDIAQAISQAEQILEGNLGHRLLPTWEVDEFQRIPRPGLAELYNLYGANPRWQKITVETDWGHYLYGGKEAKTLIDAAVPIVYSDVDTDGYSETATIVVATTITEPSEIAVYFPDENGNTAWEIRPLRSVTIAGGLATIVIERHQVVLPELWEAYEPELVNGEVDANFLATVDVYRHWSDPSAQANLVWEGSPNWGCCGLAECVACQLATQAACLTARDNRVGRITFAASTWDADALQFNHASLSGCRAPDAIRMWYRAGLQDKALAYPTLQMSPQWERAVTYLSLALLDRPLCGCNNLDALGIFWRTDLALDSGLSSSITNQQVKYQVSPRLLDNPIGTRRAEIYAWQQVMVNGNQIGRAVSW